eukprot:gene4137-7447_t
MVSSQTSSFETCSSKNLKAYISFSQQTQINSNTYFVDESGNTNNALSTNAAAIVNGACDKAVAFGATGKVEIPAKTSLLPQTFWTVEFNFKGTKPTKTETLVELFASPSISFKVDTSGLISVLVSGISISGSSLTTNYMDNTWHHVKLSKKGDLYTLTVDGREMASQSAAVLFNASPVIIGSDSTSSFSGQIDEFKIWSCSNPAEPTYPTGCPTCTSSSSCSGNGKCVAENYCLCNKGFAGSSCDLNINVDNCTAESIKAYYSFQSTDVYSLSSKKYLIDISGHGSDAEIVSSDQIFSTNGACKGSALTNGKDYFKVPFSSDFSPNGYFTVQFWFKIPTPVVTEKVILQMLDDPVIQFSALGASQISVKLKRSTDSTPTELAKGFVRNYHDNNWHYMLFQKQLNQFTVTIDGIESSFSNVNVPVNTNQQTNGIFIGADSNGNNASSGYIDELKVWSCSNVTEPDGLTDACPDCSLKNNCSGNGVCSGDYCICNPGYLGDSCSSFTCRGKSPSDVSVCSGKGICSGPENCTCQVGYSGQNCQFQSTTTCRSSYYLPPNCNIQVTPFKFTNDLSTLVSNSTISSITSCSSLFDTQSLQAIGNAQCESKNGKLFIYLGKDATVKPGEILKTNIHAGTSQAISLQDISVLAAETPVNPTALIYAPTKIGSCDDLVLTGDASSSADRRGLTYSWTVTAVSGSANGFQSIVNAATTSSFTISSGSIGAGIYDFTLTVTNFLNLKGVMTVRVEKLSSPSLVLISNPISSVLYRNMEVTLITKAEFASCFSADKTRVILWSQTSGTSIPGFSNLTLSEFTLTIPAFTFPSAGTYKFQISVKPNAYPGQEITSEFTIVISSRPVSALIQGGDKVVSKLTTFALSSSSVDPDETSETETYQWGCSTSNGDCSGLSLTPTSSISLTLFVPGTYTFTLTYQKGTRVATASTSVTSVNVEKVFPNVVIFGGSKKEFPVAFDNSIRATATLNTGSTFNYLWKQNSGPSINLDDKTKILTSKTSVELVFAASTLTVGSTYGFTVEASLSTDPTTNSSASVTFEVLSPPQVGTVVSTPTIGNESTTPFKFECKGFGGSSLQYAFYTRNVNELTILREFQSSSTLDNVHLQSVSSGVVIRCVARDIHGSTSFAEATINVNSQLSSTDYDGNVAKILSAESVINQRVEAGDAVGTFIAVGNIVNLLNTKVVRADCGCPNNCGTSGTCTLKQNTFSTYYCICNNGRAGDDCRYTVANNLLVTSFRNRMVNIILPLLQDLSSVNQQKLEKYTQIVSILTKKPSELSTSNKIQLVNILGKIGKKALTIVPSANTVANLLSTYEEIINDNAIASNGTTLDITTNLNDAFSLQSSTAYVGQSKSVSSCSVAVTTQKVLKKELDNLQVSSGNSLITLPASGFLLGVSGEEEVSVSMSKVTNNPYTPNENTQIVSELVEFSILDKNGEKIQIQNLQTPFKLQIPSKIDVAKVNSGAQILSCKYYDEQNKTWSSSGCAVSNYTTSMVECSCTHTTTFSSFIDLFTPITSSTANFTVFVTMILTLLTYVIGLIAIVAFGLVQDKFFPQEDKSDEDMGIFRYLVEELKKSHIYLSIFAKLRFNNFSRDQRWSVILVTILAIYTGNAILYIQNQYVGLNSLVAAFIAILFAVPFSAVFTFLFSITAPYPNLIGGKQQNALTVVDPNNLGRNTDFEMDDIGEQELDQHHELKEEKKVDDDNFDDDDTEGDAEPRRVQPTKKDPIFVNVDDSKEICGAIYTAFLDWGDLSFETFADTVSDPLKYVTIGGLYLFYTLVHALVLIAYILMFTIGVQTASFGLGLYVSLSICVYVGTIMFAYLNIKVRSFKNEVFEEWFSFSSIWNIINAVTTIVLFIIFVSLGVGLFVIGIAVPAIVAGSPNIVELLSGLGLGCLAFSVILAIWFVCTLVKPTWIPDIRPFVFSLDFQKDEEMRKTNSQRFMFPWWASIPIYIFLLLTSVVMIVVVFALGFNYTSIDNTGQAFNWLHASLLAILIEVFLAKPFIVLINFIGYHSIEALCYILFFTPEELRQQKDIKPNTKGGDPNVGAAHEATFGQEFEIEEMGFLPDLSDEDEDSKKDEKDVVQPNEGNDEDEFESKEVVQPNEDEDPIKQKLREQKEREERAARKSEKMVVEENNGVDEVPPPPQGDPEPEPEDYE